MVIASLTRGQSENLPPILGRGSDAIAVVVEGLGSRLLAGAFVAGQPASKRDLKMETIDLDPVVSLCPLAKESSGANGTL
jgi:hypothetical protein